MTALETVACVSVKLHWTGVFGWLTPASDQESVFFFLSTHNLHSLPFNKSLFNFVDDFLCYAEGKFLSPTIDLLNQKLWIWSSVKCVLTNLLGDSDPL